MLAHVSCMYSQHFGKLKQEDDHEFKTTFSYTVNDKPAWTAKWDPISENQKQKEIVCIALYFTYLQSWI